jgi:hypothetical protein
MLVSSTPALTDRATSSQHMSSRDGDAAVVQARLRGARVIPIMNRALEVE